MTNEHSAVQPGSPPRPILDAFFLPRGLLGRLGGRLMARGLAQQREIADLLPNKGTDLCEIGCGPGVFGALLAEQHQQLRLHLIDPSPIMRSQAARRCQQWVSNGRLDISDGTADELPLPDASCDTVVAINNLVIVARPSRQPEGDQASPPPSRSRRLVLALRDRLVKHVTTPRALR